MGTGGARWWSKVTRNGRTDGGEGEWEEKIYKVHNLYVICKNPFHLCSFNEGSKEWYIYIFLAVVYVLHVSNGQFLVYNFWKRVQKIVLEPCQCFCATYCAEIHSDF